MIRKSSAAFGWVAGLILCVSEPALATPLTVNFNSVISTQGTGGIPLTTPSGVTTDFSGNVYIADSTDNLLIKVAADGTAEVLSISGSLNAPTGLAIDSAGNLFIADTGNARVINFDSSGGASAVDTGGTSLNAPEGVALDPSGNIFIADTGNNQIVKVATDTTVSVLSTSSGVNLSTLSSPKGIATDTLGNLYIADFGNNRVVKVTPGGVGSDITSTLGTSLVGPTGVAVSSNGTVYISDTNGAPSPRVVIIDSNGTSYELSYGNFNAQLGTPTAIAISSTGIGYVADTLNSRVNRFQASSVDFGHVSLGGSSVQMTLPFTVGGGTTLTSVSATTAGTANLDFTLGNSSTCAASTTNTDCTVDVIFSPTAAGLRKGALVLSYGTGSMTVPIFGIADAPIATLSPAVASAVSVGSTTLPNPFQTAVDGAGNIYVTSYTSSSVLKIPAAGGSATTVSTGGLTLNQPTGLALDGAGNLFIADHLNSRIVEVATDGTASVLTINGLSTAIDRPTALAFDGSGNLIIADWGNGRMVRVTPPSFGNGTVANGAGMVIPTGTLTFGGSALTGATVDAAGNLYLADRTTPRIVKVDPAGQATLISPSGVGTLSGPQGVAVDPSGNLYIVDSGNQRILQITTAGATSVMAFSGATLGSLMFGLTVDAGGNLLVADWSNNRLVRVNVGQSAPSFASTAVGATSSDSPKTLTITNIGNQDLRFPVPASGANPTISSGFSLRNTGTCPRLTTSSVSAGTLSVGSPCTLLVDFAPIAPGAISGSLVLTDDSLNTAGPGYSTQTATLSGTATQTTPVVSWSTPTDISYGAALDSTQLNATSAVAGTFAYSPDAGQVLAAGSHTISVTFTPTDSATYSSVTTTTTLTVNKIATAIAVSASSSTSSGSVDLTATVTAAYGTPTGTVQFSNGSAVLGSSTLDGNGIATLTTTALPEGSSTVTADFSGDSNFLTSTGTGSASVQITPASYSISVSPTEMSMGATDTGQVTVTVTPVGGFTGTVTLSCSGLPTWEACSFSPQSFVADGSDTAQTIQLSLHSTQVAGTVSSGVSAPSLAGTEWLAWSLLPGFALGGAFDGSQRKRQNVLRKIQARVVKMRAPKAWLRRVLILIGVVAVLSVTVGCEDSPRPHMGTFTVAITATASQTATGYAGPTTQSSNFTLTINPP